MIERAHGHRPGAQRGQPRATRPALAAVDHHGARAAHADPAGVAEGQARVLPPLDLDQRVEHGGVGAGVDRERLPALASARRPAVDREPRRHRALWYRGATEEPPCRHATTVSPCSIATCASPPSAARSPRPWSRTSARSGATSASTSSCYRCRAAAAPRRCGARSLARPARRPCCSTATTTSSPPATRALALGGRGLPAVRADVFPRRPAGRSAHARRPRARRRHRGGAGRRRQQGPAHGQHPGRARRRAGRARAVARADHPGRRGGAWQPQPRCHRPRAPRPPGRRPADRLRRPQAEERAHAGHGRARPRRRRAGRRQRPPGLAALRQLRQHRPQSGAAAGPAHRGHRDPRARLRREPRRLPPRGQRDVRQVGGSRGLEAVPEARP